ncbi:MAG TPA: glutathione S-transferase N-terminal domain-containing protein [Steroidobacteraceae bacterium]|jgi:GST-like protein|nr:glutathione S-transferase N-terminal domain-containing protein [Steroidobacteraceae bacterium]
MIKFYYAPAPNPAKVALFLEEAALAYELVPIDTMKGDQFTPAFKSVNPNSKVPAIVDGDVVIFDSNAILQYLGETTGRFMPAPGSPRARGELLSWLAFVGTGVGPYSGQAVHFKRFAQEKIPYAINRYHVEAQRHWGILEERLSARRYMLGETYTIVDMAVWGWARALGYVFDGDCWATLPSVKRLFDEISARPAAQRATALATRHQFKTDIDAEARRNLFPQNSRLDS